MGSLGNILFAEDDTILRDSLSDRLLDTGYKVALASNGSEAIALAKKSHFDLALLDINMPEVNGFEVLSFIKENFPLVKVIMLTGYADLSNAIKAKKLGADDFIEKPYDLVDLLATIEQVLRS